MIRPENINELDDFFDGWLWRGAVSVTGYSHTPGN
jgi:hypothetical protein